MKILVPLAPGFEEIEAVTIIDVFRRAGLDVVSACLQENPVTGSHGIAIHADTSLMAVDSASLGAVVLPGGMPGSKNLKDSPEILSLVRELHGRGAIVAALCAAPIVLGHAGILKGKKATCYPGFEGQLAGAEYIPGPFIVDGAIITGRGPGCAIPFALKIVEAIKGGRHFESLRDDMQVYWM
jgi:4-methyl-5(b-hydroxyethyl)-thiazole monophosphate biosynthesis